MAPQDEPIDTPIGDSREGSVPAQRYVRMRKSELLEELVARDDQIADLYQQLAAALNANVDDNIDAGDGHADTTDTQSPARRGTAEKSTKIPDPPIFYNERDRDTEEFEQWYRDIKNKLEVNGDHFRNDRARQAYVESRLGGKAKSCLSHNCN
ncbi:hypothetical protein N658DRAFT_528287 [Parathielavia hyrcaniae]|uniref:Uncharacterized protein n=1 Tax=Parathielavia hyrcaniae TaxID=113614 RepID=A0AAN6PS16_9PEZI|nr:hypothetical protein N658DRAFT_528287 [Parathielavia hyrcaniae]